MLVESGRRFKNEAVKASRDLGYGNEVIAQIKAAKTDDDVSRIMCRMRNNTTTSARMERRQRECQRRVDFLAWALL